MATRVGVQTLPAYTPTGSNDPRVRQLEERVNRLMLQLRSECDRDVIQDLMYHLNCAIQERDEALKREQQLHGRVVQQMAVLDKSQRQLNDANKQIQALQKVNEEARRALQRDQNIFRGAGIGATVGGIGGAAAAGRTAGITVGGLTGGPGGMLVGGLAGGLVGGVVGGAIGYAVSK